MLAQSFKSADELGITEPQRDALCKTLVLLETGKLKHLDSDSRQFDHSGTPAKFDGLFNMSCWGSVPHSCGTIACIGGTAELIGGVSFGSPMRHQRALPAGLYGLFYVTGVGVDINWNAITPSQAATALRSYLTTGDAKWHEAVA